MSRRAQPSWTAKPDQFPLVVFCTATRPQAGLTQISMKPGVLAVPIW
jgi:hypothetical protein